MFDTVTGIGLATEFDVPFPNWPKLLRPQHFTELSIKKAQPPFPPIAIDVADTPRESCVGSVLVPPETPSSPQPFSPQHHTVPSVASTHV